MHDINRISALVKDQFPDFYKEEGEKFLAFIQAYYEYMEQEGKLTHEIQHLKDYSSISETTDEFIQYFISTFLPSVPVEVAADKRLMVKYINYFNQTRGTLAAYKLLFRAIYNEEIEVEYPADQILKVSDGDWRRERYLVSSYDPASYSFIGKTIRGQESGAEALVEDIVRKNIRGRDIMQILLSNIKGEFNHLEPIRLLTDTSSSGHAPLAEAGIREIDIISAGGEYRVGDVVNLLSFKQGDFGKVVVTQTQDLGGSLTFSIVEGGSGYTVSTEEGGTQINFSGGDGTDPASFQIGFNDIGDTFAIALNTNLITSNTVFGAKAPTVNQANGVPQQLSTFANMMLSSPDFGFPEEGEIVTSTHFRDSTDGALNIANTRTIQVGDSLFGQSSQANAVVTQIIDNTAGDTWLRVDSYRNFTVAETANNGSVSVGTVGAFQANAIGQQVLEVGNVAGETISVGDELVGVDNGAFGVVKKIIKVESGAYEPDSGPNRDLVFIKVSANTSANLSSQFDNGPLGLFEYNEGLRKVGSSTPVGNVASQDSANSTTSHIYTRLRDVFLFETSVFGTIETIGLPVGGAGYSIAPTIEVTEPNIAALGIGEAYVTIQSDENWGTGNSSITSLDTNERLIQPSTGAKGDVKGGAAPNQSPAVTVYSNGTVETTVRMWQDFLQREPGKINWANNDTVTINFYSSSYVPGLPDERPIVETGSAKIVAVQDQGILGQNANITAGVGANGTIVSVRVLDSGFAYQDNEILLVESTNRPLATSARLQIGLNGVANSEGYYATTRSHLDSLRGYIQDSRFYQEYSYQIISPISLDRYREYALKLVHPAGQALFGKFRSQSNVEIGVETSSNNRTRLQATGSVDINQGSFEITGNATAFSTGAHPFANGDIITIEYAKNQFFDIPLNIVSDDTTANLTIAWSNSSITSANVYFLNGDM
jgi:hypothetical protein